MPPMPPIPPMPPMSMPPPIPPMPPAVVMVMIATIGFFLDRNFGNQRLGGQQQGSDAGRIGQRCANDFGWVDDTGSNEVTIFLCVGIVAFGLAFHLADAIDNNGTIQTSVVGDRTKRLIKDSCE